MPDWIGYLIIFGFVSYLIGRAAKHIDHLEDRIVRLEQRTGNEYER